MYIKAVVLVQRYLDFILDVTGTCLFSFSRFRMSRFQQNLA